MSESGKTYWQSLDELAGEPPTSPTLPVVKTDSRDELGRRTFLKMAGFSVGALVASGCMRGEDRAVVPYLVAPEEVIPGRPYFYATVCGACSAACGVLAKALDGRPVKLEGNPTHPLSGGGLCAIGQASVLGLYDSQRLAGPVKGGQEASWGEVDAEIARGLERAAAAGGRVRFLTDSCLGPTELAAVQAFLARFEDGRLVTYDAVSQTAIQVAHQRTHGAAAVPRYHFDRAQVIVSVGADFLGSWISPVEYAAAYQEGRQVEHERAFSHHVQIESRLSLTGSNSDQRIVVKPGAGALVLAHLAERVARGSGTAPPWGTLPAVEVEASVLDEIAYRLLHAQQGASLVVCGDNDPDAQVLVNYLNEMLGNYASTEGTGTVDLNRPSLQKRGSDAELLELRDELQAGSVDALFMRAVNPVYDLPFGTDFAANLVSVDLVVSLAERIDETAEKAHLVCPEPHFLEAWGDSEPVAGVVALRQPALRPLGETRPLLESIATWSGNPQSALDQLRANWQATVYPRARTVAGFKKFWNRSLHDGWAGVDPPTAPAGAFDPAAVSAPAAPAAAAGLVAEVFPSLAVSDGRHAHNAWLQELPDPIAKTTWDNHACLSPATARELGVETGSEVQIEGVGEALLLPVLVQPGQHSGVVSLALGYGRSGTDRFRLVGPQWLEGHVTVEEGGTVGTNAAPLINEVDGFLRAAGLEVTVTPTGVTRDVACTQMHHTLKVPEKLASYEGETRDIVRETTVGNWKHAGDHHSGHDDLSLWRDHEMEKHHWGMVVDLTACTGCSACVMSCQAENNIPVVGRDEVVRVREMHWMRIDRYYSGDEDDIDVVHMPMMCQHCDNAPCETVCPVQATAQSAEGLNQQIYNRCVGTRYCANNCPYKVRRFNWFNYPREDRLQNMVLNPDVTVRTRGVMEKCSLCVQRIQYAKSEAKRDGRELVDGDITPACAQSCPSKAITFGDMNDPESRLSQAKQDPRHYAVLAELGIKPVVGYLTKVRNRTEKLGSNEHS